MIDPHGGAVGMFSQKFPDSLSGSGGGGGASKPQSSVQISTNGSLPPIAEPTGATDPFGDGEQGGEKLLDN